MLIVISKRNREVHKHVDRNMEKGSLYVKSPIKRNNNLNVAKIKEILLLVLLIIINSKIFMIFLFR